MSLREDLQAGSEDRDGSIGAGDTTDGSSQWRSLMRTAYLLTGDPLDAEELAARASSPNARRREPSPGTGDVEGTLPVAVVRRRLVRLAVSPWERWVALVRRLVQRLEQRLVHVPGQPPGQGPDAAPDGPLCGLFLACLRLPVRERAAVVLRYGEGLSGAEAAEALAVDVRQVRRLTARALSRLARHPLPATAPGESLKQPQDGRLGHRDLLLDLGEQAARDDGGVVAGPVGAIEAQLPAVLDAAASRLPAGTALRRPRRGRLLAGLAAAVAAVLLVGLAGLAVVLVAPSPWRNARAMGADVTTWPTRGDLATRPDLVSRVRAVVGARQPVLAVPFLGDVAGLAVAIVVTQGEQGSELTVLYGHATAPVTTWSRQEGARLDMPELPVLSAAVDDGTGRVHLVALTTTTGGVALAWSPTAVMDADGFLRRRYTQFSLSNGVGVAAVPGNAAVFALRASTARHIVITPFTVVAGGQSAVRYSSVQASRSSSCRSYPLAPTLDRTLDTLADQGRVRARDIERADLVWCRSEGAHDRMLVAVTAVTGAAVQIVVEGTKTGMGGYRWSMRSRPVPAGRASSAAFTLVADDEDVIPDRGPLRVLVSAPGAVRAELRKTGSAGVLAAVRLDPEGYGVAALPAADRHLYLRMDGGLELVLLDGGGHELERLPAGLPDDDPWGQRLDGPVSPPT
jgi:Sigma-70, region 4